MTSLSTPTNLLLLLLLSVSTVLAEVPPAERLRYVNEGDYITENPTEYGAWYRRTPLFTSPFQLMWYNTTPDQFYVGLRMGLLRSSSLLRWVWDANRGRPVGENATLTLAADGNLVLADSDGSVAWQTNTANKGVVGVKILPVGNIVLYDKQGRFVWQSFDHPTDTLLPGQSLRVAGAALVSRRSAADNSADGIYRLDVTPLGFSMSMSTTSKQSIRTSNNDPLSLLPYAKYRRSAWGEVTAMRFIVILPEAESGRFSTYELALEFTNKLANGSLDTGRLTLANPKYNASLSILRLGLDGDLVAYTYYNPVNEQAWEKTFDAFSSENGLFFTGGNSVGPCGLPTKCGSLGVCEDGECVACPSPKGLLGYSRSCAPPRLRCPPAVGGGGAKYYRVAGVEHLVTSYTEGEKGKVKVEECMRRCSALGCRCVGFFYWEESRRCWLAPVLGTVTRVPTSSHLAYIKSSS